MSTSKVHSNMSLSELKGGAVEELYQDALGKVFRNIHDPNAPAGKGTARTITVTMKLTPSQDRGFIAVDVEVACKLAGPMPVSTAFNLKGERDEDLVGFEPEQISIYDSRPTN